MKTKKGKTSGGRRVLVHSTRLVGRLLIETLVTARSAVLDFKDVLAAARVEVDDAMGPPWKEHDGWEHTVLKNVDETHPGGAHWDHFSRCRAVFPGRAYGDSYNMIVVDRATLEEWHGAYDFFRGESRQVYEERLAAARAAAVATLVRWYTEGYRWYGVVCEFRGRQASVWGVQTKDDSADDPYLDEVRAEMALEVAALLEEDGYTVHGQPAVPDPHCRAVKQNNLRWRVAHHLGFATQEAYRTWLAN